MKQLLVSTAFAMAFAVMAVGCAGETAGPSETGTVSVNLIVGDTDVTAVAFEVECDSGITLNGNFNVVDDRTPPIWATIMDLPVGICTVTLLAQDDTGATLCTASENVEVLENQTVKVDLVLVCEEDAEEALGNLEIDATFEIIQGNLCPRLHFLNAVPINVPASGSEVTVLVSDGDGDTLTTALTAPGGTFSDPSAQLTTYFCDGAAGGQTISVTVTDGDTACDKSKSFDVVCPGVDPCEGVTCDDTGNECTAAECVDGVCVESPVQNGTMCTIGGGGGELTVNGDFEQGAGLPGWTQFCIDTNGVCEATMEEAESGLWSGNLVVQGGIGDAVIKNANIGIGTVTPNSPVTVSVDIKGNTADGGVVFVQFFSELSGGGVSKEEFVANAVQATDTWTTYTLETTTGPDVSGGVTLQLKSTCGAAATCVADVYFDNASVIFGSGGEAGTCQEGVCEPIPECVVAGDCPATGNECIDPVCDAGTCGTSFNTDPCDGGNGTCDGAGVCVQNPECVVATDCPATGNECIDPVCNAGVCETSNNTNACDNDTGTCSAGVCEPNEVCEYTQDFESLDQASATALADDGWVVGANVFASDGTTFLYNYFTFPAPNGGPAFSGIDIGQGGAAQGAQQMVIYNDYGNADHTNGTGNVIEANVFQERPIVAADIGTTITFTFDAKMGNIESPTTAQAFLKTLNPGAGFSESSSDTVDTTSLGDTWGTYTLAVEIDGTVVQVGHLLQFGALSRAANETPSGNFYDNMSVCSAPTP